MRVPNGAVAVLLLGGGCSGNNLGTDTKFDDAEITAADGAVRLDEDGSAPIVLVAESTVEPVSYQIVAQPTLGQLVGAGAQWEYVPDPDVSGEDVFTWKAVAGEVESAVATVTVSIDPVNDAPVGTAVQVGTAEDTPIADRLLALDVEGDPLTFTIVSAPQAGRIDLNPQTGEYTYTPDVDFTGSDELLWSAFDPSGASTGPVRVDVTVADTNDPPEILADTFVVAEDDTVDGALVGNDPDGDPLIWRVDEGVAHGTLQLNSNLGTFTYAPWPDYSGPDAFTVVASDGGADSAPVAVSLVVTAVNDAPEMPPAILEVDEDGDLVAVVTGTDVEGDALSYRVDSPPRDGVLALDPTTGAITYDPAPNWSGVDEFTVVASDAALDSVPGRVTVVVRAVNDAPTASGGSLLLTQEDTSVAGAIRGVDPEGDALTFVVAAAPAHGTLTLSPSTGDYVFTPAQDFNGVDGFSIQASDGQADSAPAVVTVQVLAQNDVPRLTPVTLTAVEGSTATLVLPAVDPEGDLLYFLVSTPPQHGVAALDSLTGVLQYTPTAGYFGSDVLLFTVSDGQGAANGILPITVAPDSDGDEIADLDDNCPAVDNPTQSDVNDNTLGDACDCWSTPFGATLDPARWEASAGTSAVGDYTSPSHAVALLGDGAFLQTWPQIGCPAHQVELEVQLGTPPPELGDALVLSASVDGGPWVVVHEVFGTGSEESFSPLLASTAGLELGGAEIAWRIEVVGDQIDDVFTVDDLIVSCDTDADWLPDCVETWIPGYDLEEGDADGDGWLDGDEYAAGSDPTSADTDLDGVEDPGDNCPTVFNPTQSDGDGNGFGDACDLSVHDDFAAGVFDPAMWAAITGDGAVTTEFAYSDTYSLRLSGGGAIAEALPIDFRACDAVAWFFQLKPGPEPPDSTDHFKLEVWNGATWEPLLDFVGNSASVSTFTPRIGRTTNASARLEGARFRFNAPVTTSGVGYDEWFVDDVAIGCDADDDDLPSYYEQKVSLTNPFVADTDGDGVADGAEVVAGTNPNGP